PPFIYSYQCTSTFITTYATIYVLMFVISAFLAPVVLGTCAALHRYLEKQPKTQFLVGLGLPKVLKHAPVLASDRESLDVDRNSLSSVNSSIFFMFAPDDIASDGAGGVEHV